MSEWQTVLTQAQRLSPTEQWQLIKCLTEQLAESPRQSDCTNDALQQAIVEYAVAVAGSEFDLDTDFLLASCW